ncbi:uncharacterized protein LOC131676139 [Topomyia yanbarensis]|uniref:uncharacterized protein LOC131676139 n=1 Tax=Topomyia yanbarensis TaxID=2498891 RepID=UPI00273B1061|nr:uncharacterized protein LOC131676139 [Topomyia yanbarensis]
MFGGYESAHSEDRCSRYVLDVRNQKQVQTLLALKKLLDGTPVEINYHRTLNTCKCVVSSFDLIHMSEEDLLAEWKGRKVTEVHRITRPTLDGGREKTNTLKLTIFGTTIPEHLFVGPIRIPTRIFYPAPMVCFQCLQYGHSKTRCKSKEVCPNCSKSAHVAEGERCIEPAYCRNCEGPHSASSRDCPAYKIEKEIMRIKVEQGISFNEARKNYNARNALTSFANIVKESTSTIK